MSDSSQPVDALAISLFHDSVEPYTYADGDALVVRLRVAKGFARRIDVVHMDKFQIEQTRVTTQAEVFSDAGALHESDHGITAPAAYSSRRRWCESTMYTIYQAKLVRESKRFKYWFRIHSASGVRFFSRQGVTQTEPHPDDAFETPYLGERDRFAAPEWARGVTYYQVFPERFARSSKAMADPSKTGLAAWDSVPTPFSFYGGDLQGIIEHLDHLGKLGVGVLYMTPIFTAPSNHKYDTVDYLQIDPQFGDLETFRKLVAACHERGIKVVLDAVFNHMGAQHPIFLDLLEKGEESPFRDYIYAKSWPLSTTQRNYETFGYVANMPKWRTAHPEVEEYLCQVGEYWIREADIDGWRLDVSDEVEHRFWQHFRDRIKALKPDALICGEIWQVATPWLRGNEFDAVMNYPLGRAILDWLAKGKADAHGFHDAIDSVRTAYPEPVLHTLWNLLDSHDTPRLLTECRGDVTRMKLATFLQFTFAGSPLLYYGDEVGMKGAGDPLCRAGMVWNERSQNMDLFAHYQTLMELRNTYEALRIGDVRPLAKARNRQLYAFMRRSERQMVMAIVYAGKQPTSLALVDQRLPDGTWTIVYGSEIGAVVRTGATLTIAPRSAMLLVWTGDEYGN